MAKLLLKRDLLTDDFTLGTLAIDGNHFCYTVEDAVRDKKIAGITAIPYGKYKIIVNMSPRFKRLLPRLLDVPNFAGVLIHAGNTAADSEGCILVGFGRTASGVSLSRNAMSELMAILKASTTPHEIEIV